MVGRAAERGVLERLLQARGGVVVIEGEAGIGKSSLLAHLAGAAEGVTVLHGRATGYEGELPYGLWRAAREPHLAELGERRVSLLGLEDPEALAAVLPGWRRGTAVIDRHAAPRALRALLERLAALRPLLVCLDDVHWADPATVDALAALVVRPPRARARFALATRENQLPRPLARAIGADRAQVLRLAPLSRDEAAALVGAPAAGVYDAAGGNPFYLEQLARVGALADGAPPAVAAAIEAELAALSGEARALLDAAAVAGDPFDLD